MRATNVAEPEAMHRFFMILVGVDARYPEEDQAVSVSPAQILPDANQASANRKEVAPHP